MWYEVWICVWEREIVCENYVGDYYMKLLWMIVMIKEFMIKIIIELVWWDKICMWMYLFDFILIIFIIMCGGLKKKCKNV